MDTPRFMTRSEVAALFRVTPKTIAHWVKIGRLSSIKTPGGHWRFLAAEVEGLLEVGGRRG